MEKEDARSLSSAEQHERRRQVIRAYKRGRSRTQIAEEVGLSYTAVSKTIARYESLGVAALAPRKRGRRTGEDRALTEDQEQAIQRLICDKRPEQLKMEFALWSRAAVMQLIEREYGVVLHVRSVGKYLGLHASKADQASVRAVAGGGTRMAGYSVPADRHTRQG